MKTKTLDATVARAGEPMTMTTNSKLDATVSRDGGIYMFTPLSDGAKTWVQDNVHTDPWQWTGPSFVLDDGRLAYELYRGMLDAGFAVGDP